MKCAFIIILLLLSMPVLVNIAEPCEATKALSIVSVGTSAVAIIPTCTHSDNAKQFALYRPFSIQFFIVDKLIHAIEIQFANFLQFVTRTTKSITETFFRANPFHKQSGAPLKPTLTLPESNTLMVASTSKPITEVHHAITESFETYTATPTSSIELKEINWIFIYISVFVIVASCIISLTLVHKRKNSNLLHLSELELDRTFSSSSSHSSYMAAISRENKCWLDIPDELLSNIEKAHSILLSLKSVENEEVSNTCDAAKLVHDNIHVVEALLTVWELLSSTFFAFGRGLDVLEKQSNNCLEVLSRSLRKHEFDPIVNQGIVAIFGSYNDIAYWMNLYRDTLKKQPEILNNRLPTEELPNWEQIMDIWAFSHTYNEKITSILKIPLDSLTELVRSVDSIYCKTSKGQKPMNVGDQAKVEKAGNVVSDLLAHTDELSDVLRNYSEEQLTSFREMSWLQVRYILYKQELSQVKV